MLGGVAVPELDMTALGAAIEAKMRTAGTELAFGRYASRAFYRAASFTNTPPANRALSTWASSAFARAGTPIFAPLDSEVVLVADNAAELDYGPLDPRAPRAGQRFFTLWGT